MPVRAVRPRLPHPAGRSLAGAGTERALAADFALAPPGGDPQPVVLSQEEFEAHVRQALRDLTRPELLARNTLLRARVVQAEGEDASALAALLREAAASLTVTPGDRAWRAVDATYLRPRGTQEAAAAVLACRSAPTGGTSRRASPGSSRGCGTGRSTGHAEHRWAASGLETEQRVATGSLGTEGDRTMRQKNGERAVVLGGGMAGLLAARVLSDSYDCVTVVDRDVLGEAPGPRRGVPQGRHVHVLAAGGLQVLRRSCPA